MANPQLRFKKSVLAVSATLVPMLAIPAHALAQAKDPDEKMERVVVTGSSIKRIDAETALPVQVLKREDIERSGATSTEQLIKQISSFSSAGSVSTAAAAGTQTGSISAVSLRGLGAARTLVLINGRRSSVYGGSSSGFAGAAVDINNIPLSAIERVEVLKDGASAVYGSDAIAGVVNFILRKDYNGVEVTGGYGATEAKPHAAEKRASLFAGFGKLNEEGYNVTFGANVQQVDPIMGIDRDYARRINAEYGNDLLSNISFPANVRIPTTGKLVNPMLPNCGPRSVVSPNATTICSFDNSPDVSIQPGSKRANLMLNGRLKLSETAEGYFESAYSQNKTRTTTQSVPLSFNTNLPDSNPYNAYFRNLVATKYPSLNTKPFTSTFGAANPGAFLLPPSSPYYPTAWAAANGLAGQPLILAYRDEANGARNQTDQADAGRFVVGVRGSAAGWDYDAGLLYSQNKVKEILETGYPQYSKILPLLDSGVINPFGPTTDASALAAARAAEFVGAVYNSKTSVTAVNATASRELMQLPAGTMGLAVGGEFRTEKFAYDPSLAVQTGDIAGQGGNQLPVSAQRHVSGVYAEVNVPILKSLEADFAVRYDNYQRVGSTTNPKASIRWQPSDKFMFRSAVGTGFRAPSLTDLYAAQASSVTANGTRDPLRCPDAKTGNPTDCNNQFPTITGGNPNLKPEKALSITAGILVEPIRDMSLSFDAFRVNLKDAIVGGGLSASYMLSNPTNATKYAQYILRGPADPTNASGLGAITSILQTNANLFKTQMAGVDLDGKYALRMAEGRKVIFHVNGTYLAKYDVQGPDGSYTSSLDQASSAANGVQLRWKHNASATYVAGAWEATLMQNYQKAYHDVISNKTLQPHDVSAYTTYDAQVSYTGFKSLKLTAGLRNLTDRDPPYTNYSPSFVGGYDISYADVRGRYAYVNATYRF
jgi:iron complex outermembrane recepter protein